MKITGKEPAYPVLNSDGFCTSLENVSGKDAGATGLTIRQQFAMAAMQGLISQAQSSEAAQNKYTCNDGWVEPITICRNAVTFADALIAELNRTEE